MPFSFLPLLAQNFGANDVLQSALLTANIAIVAVGNLLAAQMVRRIDPYRLVFASFAVITAGIAMAAAARSLALVFAAQALLGLGSGINYPILMGMSIQRVDSSKQTTAMGVYQSVYAIGMFAGPWLSGILAHRMGLQPMFAATAAAVLAMGLMGTALLQRLLAANRAEESSELVHSERDETVGY
jgi:MFS family permease